MGNKLQQPVKMTKETTFDLASVTKVMGRTQGIMKPASDGVIDINEPVRHIFIIFFIEH